MKKLYIWWFCSFAVALIQSPLMDSACFSYDCTSLCPGYNYSITCSDMLAGSISSQVKVFAKATGSTRLVLSNLEWTESIITSERFLPNVKTNIVRLRIEGGQFTQLMNKIFTNEVFEQLEMLEFCYLSLNDLPRLLSKTTPHLKSLYLENLMMTSIQLPSIPSLIRLGVFNCTSLNNLNISNLMLKAELPRLEWLEFFGNNITNTITDNSFSDLKNIKWLHLSNNQIESIPGNAFANLPSSIRTINLTKNNLKTLPDMFFTILNRLENNNVIDLSDNLFECGCDIQNIQKNLRNFYDKFAKTPFCFERGNALNYAKVSITNMPNYTCETPDKNEIEDNCYSLCKIVKPQVLSLTKLLQEIRIESESIDKYLITTKYPTNYSFLYFEDGFNNSTRFKCKMHIEIHQKGHVEMKLPLKPNHLHQFCMMKNESLTLSLLECILFHTKPKTIVTGWITKEYRAIAIAAWTFIGVITFAIGIYLSFVAAKRFPKLLGLKVKKPVIIYRNKPSNFNRCKSNETRKCFNDEMEMCGNSDEADYAYVISNDYDYIVLDNIYRIAPPLPQRSNNRNEYIVVIN